MKKLFLVILCFGFVKCSTEEAEDENCWICSERKSVDSVYQSRNDNICIGSINTDITFGSEESFMEYKREIESIGGRCLPVN